MPGTQIWYILQVDLLNSHIYRISLMDFNHFNISIVIEILIFRILEFNVPSDRQTDTERDCFVVFFWFRREYHASMHYCYFLFSMYLKNMLILRIFLQLTYFSLKILFYGSLNVHHNDSLIFLKWVFETKFKWMFTYK